ncbi:DUF2303 family protein [Pararhodobacter zhoushanensis]|uniref:DUF2303 family protein n=1 Tax=Pararhodobacter zhoushanensis TaxID=2479545 RepID=UPI000F8C8DCA|nr:DUF2303 family protein [Pararhodobacter zhoushanensis]
MAQKSTETPADVPLVADICSPRETLETVLAGVALNNPHIELTDGREFIRLPGDHKLQDVSNPDRPAPFIKQLVTVDDRASLVAYVNRFSDPRSVLVADYDAGAIRAMLDYHGDNGAGDLLAGPLKHAVTLKLRDSEEFKRWNAMQGKKIPQDEFAAFLEENSEDICEPDPTVMIEISRDLEATQGVTFKSSVRLENGDRSFVYETDTRTRGELHIPREFKILIPLYQGEEPVELRCAFRWNVGGGGLVLGFEWRRVEYLRQAYFAQIAAAASEGTGRPLFYGRLAG